MGVYGGSGARRIVATEAARVPSGERSVADRPPRLLDHLDGGAPAGGVELLEQAPVNVQARTGLVPELGGHLEHVETLEDQQAGEATAEVARDGVRRKADVLRRRLEDALAPVVPAVTRPSAEDQLVLCRPAAADAELGEVAGERCEQFGMAWLDPAALRRAVVDRALAYLPPLQRQCFRFGTRARVCEEADEHRVAVPVELRTARVATAALVAPLSWIEHPPADQLDVVRRDRPGSRVRPCFGLATRGMGLRSISSSRSARLRIERNTVSVLMIVGSPTPCLRSLATHASIGAGRSWRSW